MNQLSCPKDNQGVHVCVCVCLFQFALQQLLLTAFMKNGAWQAAKRGTHTHTLDTTCLQQRARLQFGVTFNQQLVSLLLLLLPQIGKLLST